MEQEQKNAVVIATAAVALQRPPKSNPAALHIIDQITRHLTGVIRALEELKQELRK